MQIPCKKMASDGEGATALFECKIIGAKSKDDANEVVRDIVQDMYDVGENFDTRRFFEI